MFSFKIIKPNYPENQENFQDESVVALRDLTLQQTFDYCLQHLAQQFIGSFVENLCEFAVAHHHPDGRKSAIGYFVAPCDYRRDMEGHSISSFSFAVWREKQGLENSLGKSKYYTPRPNGNLSHDKLHLLIALQRLHNQMRPTKKLVRDESGATIISDDHFFENAAIIAEDFDLLLDVDAIDEREYGVIIITD